MFPSTLVNQYGETGTGKLKSKKNSYVKKSGGDSPTRRRRRNCSCSETHRHVGSNQEEERKIVLKDRLEIDLPLFRGHHQSPTLDRRRRDDAMKMKREKGVVLTPKSHKNRSVETSSTASKTNSLPNLSLGSTSASQTDNEIQINPLLVKIRAVKASVDSFVQSCGKKPSDLDLVVLQEMDSIVELLQRVATLPNQSDELVSSPMGLLGSIDVRSSWERFEDPDSGHEYFYNPITKETAWTLPGQIESKPEKEGDLKLQGIREKLIRGGKRYRELRGLIERSKQQSDREKNTLERELARQRKRNREIRRLRKDLASLGQKDEDELQELKDLVTILGNNDKLEQENKDILQDEGEVGRAEAQEIVEEEAIGSAGELPGDWNYEEVFLDDNNANLQDFDQLFDAVQRGASGQFSFDPETNLFEDLEDATVAQENTINESAVKVSRYSLHEEGDIVASIDQVFTEEGTEEEPTEMNEDWAKQDLVLAQTPQDGRRWPLWSRRWDAGTQSYMYINNYEAFETNEAPEGATFIGNEEGSPLLDIILQMQQWLRTRRAEKKKLEEREKKKRWSKHHDPDTNRAYFFNSETEESEWVLPAGISESSLLSLSHKSNNEGLSTSSKSEEGNQSAVAKGEEDVHAGNSGFYDTENAVIEGLKMGVGETLEGINESKVADGLTEQESFAELLKSPADVFGELTDILHVENESVGEFDGAFAEGIDFDSALDFDIQDALELDVDEEDEDEGKDNESTPVCTPKSISILQRRGSRAALKISTGSESEDVHDAEESDSFDCVDIGEIVPFDAEMWALLNAKATPTGRQAGGWAEKLDASSGEVFFVNLGNGECMWDPPEDFERRASVGKPRASQDAWELMTTPSNIDLFYYNFATGWSLWNKPHLDVERNIPRVALESESDSGPSLQTERLWAILREHSTPLESCGPWVQLEVKKTFERYYFNDTDNHCQWEEPEDWDGSIAIPNLTEEVDEEVLVEEDESKVLGEETEEAGLVSIGAGIKANKFIKRLSERRLRRTWSCIISIHERCLFEFNWETGDARKSLNMFAKQVNPVRRFLLHNTTVASNTLQVDCPARLPGGTRHLWTMLKERATEQRQSKNWIEYFDEQSRERFFGSKDNREWQWEEPNEEFKEVVLKKEWKQCTGIDGSSFWINEETGETRFKDPDEETGNLNPRKSNRQPFIVNKSGEVLSPKGKKVLDFGFKS